MPAITKLTLEDKLLYKTVVNAHGMLGATVNKIDYGTSLMQMSSTHVLQVFTHSMRLTIY
jgi:hypothetical protein